jgi:ribosome biogenesis GTPase A
MLLSRFFLTLTTTSTVSSRRDCSISNHPFLAKTKTIMIMMLLLSLWTPYRRVTAFVPRPLIATTRRVVPSLCRLYASFGNDNTSIDDMDALYDTSISGYARPVIQWYPGHIAKAERSLQETLKAVDVVVEVRDARALLATAHPLVPTWCAGKPRIVAVTHVDCIPKAAQRAWSHVYQVHGDTVSDMQKDGSTIEGGGRTPTIMSKQIRNQARQAQAERSKYSSSSTHGDASSSSSPVEAFVWINAQRGQGIPALHRAIVQAGAYVQERRQRRGLFPRPLRVGCLGYPNVGKSALINQLLGRTQAPSKNIPGVTKSLQWIRVRPNTNSNKHAADFELLDSPGIIPASLDNQEDAWMLAACHCIGQAAYDNQGVAALLCTHLVGTSRSDRLYAPQWRDQCQARYQFDPWEEVAVVPNMEEEEDDCMHATTTRRPRTGEDMLHQVADNTCQGDLEDASRKILQDFRKGRMGPICLQPVPVSLLAANNKDTTTTTSTIIRTHASPTLNVDPTMGASIPQKEMPSLRKSLQEQQQQQRAQRAQQIAAERGLALPPIVMSPTSDTTESSSAESASSDNDKTPVGRGLFEGW